MKGFLKYILFIIILGLILYGLYIYNGKIIVYFWFGYTVYSNIFALVLLVVTILLLFYLVSVIRSKIYLLFYKVSLNHTLSEYIKRIELSESIDKEIQLKLIDDIKDLKTLKLITYLNGLIQKRQYSKALSIIRKKESKTNLRSILNYTRVEAMLASGLKKDAKDLCKYYLSSNKNNTWAFLKLYDIVLNDSDSDYTGDFEFLNKYLMHNKLKVSEDLIEQVYCIINFKVAKKEYGVSNESMAKRLKLLIKKFPKFTPGYILLFKYLNSINKREEAIKLITDSWQYNITYENTIFIDNILSGEKKELLVKECKSLIKSNKENDRMKLLLVIIYASHNEFINVNETMIKIKNTSDSLYKITKLYLFLKENNIKGRKQVIQDLVQELPLNWWNEYLKYLK